MNVVHTQFVMNKQRLEIYLAGCKGINGVHCKGCHNPQSWDFNAGKEIDIEKLVTKAQNSFVKNVFIAGGEPLDQDKEQLVVLLSALHQCNKPIWLFTRYSLGSISNDIMQYISYVKTGEYDEQLLTSDNVQFGVSLASTNQMIYQIKTAKTS